MTHHATFSRLFNRMSGKYSRNVIRLGAAFSLVLVQAAHAASTGSGLIPCDGPDCDLNSVIQLANTLMTFFFKTLLLPLFVVMIIYLGYSYIAAQGKPGQHAKLGSMAKHMVLGLLLMLLAWAIVRTVLSLIGYHDDLLFFGN
jgi:hypothetical protein